MRFAARRKPAPWTSPAVYHELRSDLVARDGCSPCDNKRAINAMPQRGPHHGCLGAGAAQRGADLDHRLASMEKEIAEVLRDGA